MEKNHAWFIGSKTFRCFLKTSLVCSGIALALLSCREEERDTIVFPEKARTLVATKVPMNAILHPSFLAVKGDRFIIGSRQTDTLFYYYSTPDLVFERAYGRIGKGPGEFGRSLEQCMSPRSDRLYMHEIPKYIWSLEVESDGIRRKQENPLEFSFTQRFYYALNFLQDSIMIDFVALDTEPNKLELLIRKFDIKNSRSIGEIRLYDPDHTSMYDYMPFEQMVANDSCIVYAYPYEKQIDIYDLQTLELKRRLKGKNHQEENVPKPPYGLYYVQMVPGEHYVYVQCQTAGEVEEGRVQDEYILEVFDYEGNPVKSFILNPWPYDFAVDEKNGMIYGVHSDFEGDILRYDMR